MSVSDVQRKPTKCKVCGKLCAHMHTHISRSERCRNYYMDMGRTNNLDVQQELNENDLAHYQELQKYEAFKSVAEWVYFRFMAAPQYDAVVEAHKLLVEKAMDSIKENLGPILNDMPMEEMVLELVRDRMDFFSGLETMAQLDTYACQHYPVLPMSENRFGNGRVSYTLPLSSWIVELMRNNREVRIIVEHCTHPIDLKHIYTPKLHSNRSIHTYCPENQPQNQHRNCL